jgi:hypothetical protein
MKFTKIMKPLIKVLSLAAIAAVACFTVNNVSAQTSYIETLATWSFSQLPNGAGGLPPAPVANITVPPGGENVIIFPITKGPGMTNLDAGFNAAYGGEGFTNNGVGDSEANSITSGLYVTYAIQAAPGYSISFSTNYFYLDSSATGCHSNMLQYSSDGVNFTDLTPFTIPSGSTAIIWTNNVSTFAQLQNVSSTVTNYFRIVMWGAAGSTGTWFLDDPPPKGTPIGTNDMAIYGTVSAASPTAPSDAVVTPASQTVDAGQNVAFTVSANGFPATNLWYFVYNGTTNLIAGATNATLSLPGVLGGNSGGYFVVLTNFEGSATSEVATLTVTNDPNIQAGPNYTYALVDGVAQFSVTAFGTGPISYTWYFTDPSGNAIALANNGNTTASGLTTIYGQGTSELTLSNVQTADLTNFVVVISNIYGKQTSSVASILAVTNIYFDYLPPYFESQPPITPLVLWDFNGPIFTNTFANPNAEATPSPYLGVGTALPVGSCNEPGTSPFAGSTDPSDGPGFDTIVPSLGDHLPNNSWGVENYPLNSATSTTNNKTDGIQFNVSTVGAKNVFLSYDSRVSATASDYERIQYTTNGTTWVDYPSSSTFGTVATTYVSYQNDFSGFPGVANNPNFGIRIVTEYQSTATYGIGPSNMFVGTGNTYGSTGTTTYDLVGLFGDAITNNNVPPVISPFTNVITGQIVTNGAYVPETSTTQTTLDNVPITNSFFVSGDANATQFTYSAVSLNQATVSPSFTFTPTASGGVTLVTTPNPIAANAAAAPILVSVTDANGDVSKSWFLLSLTSEFPAPTNNLGTLGTTNTSFVETNTLANTALPIKFTVGSPVDSVHQFTYSSVSLNNTVVPAANIVVNTNTPGTPTNPIVTITPAFNQLGVAIVGIAENDNDATEAKSTTTTFPLMVRPNTNIIAIDYFNYDNSGPLDSISDGYWQHLSGNFGTVTVNSSPSGGTATLTVSAGGDTENLQTPLIGSPYAATNKVVPQLFYSFLVSKPSASDINTNGSWISGFSDGIVTDNEGLLIIGTNSVATNGNYRVGIANDQNYTAANGANMFPQDLVPGSNYVIVVSLNLSNGVSTVWLNPSNSSSPSVTEVSDSGTLRTNITDFEFRQSGNEDGNFAGIVHVSYLKVGKTFNSVLQLPTANNATYTVPFGGTFSVTITNLEAVAGWFDPNGLVLSLDSVGPTSFDGTNVTTDGTSIFYGGPVVDYDNFPYTFGDGFFTIASTVSLIPVLQMNGSETLNGAKNPIISGTSPIGAAGYTYGVEYATNLLGQWFEAGNVLVQPSGAWSFTDIHQTNPPVIFYRVYYPDNPSSPPQQ